MLLRLAIDLGSSHTVAVLRDPAGPPRPMLFDGSELLPSGVYADAAGGLAVGRDAERLALTNPAWYEPHPKRRVDDGTVLLGRPVDVRDAFAAVLARVAEQVQPSVRTTSVVLTCPAGWGEPRRRVLVEAGARAGLGPATLVSEPIAAAAYFTAVLRRDLAPGAAIAVVDVGAGTTDVAVVRSSARAAAEVVAQSGLDLGGIDIDAALVGLIGDIVRASDPEAWQALAEPVTPAGRRDRLVLWREVRAAKESLSRLSVVPVHLPGHAIDLHLTRGELDAVAMPLLAPVAGLAEQVIATAGFSPDQLAGVFLVGGGSRIPLLARLLHARLAVAPTVVERPETVVVEGALHAVGPAEPGGGPPADELPEDERRGSVQPPTPAPRRAGGPRSMRRWLNPAVLVLALLCFLLPFATVSCGLPGGYGRAKPSGTTAYTGVDLVVGGTPDVSAGHVLPRPQWRTDRLAPQLLPLVALLAALAAAVTAGAVRPPRRRRKLVAALAAASAVSLLAGQAVVVDLLAERIRAQSTVPDGKTAHDFVGTGIGFWLALILLAGAATGNAIGMLRRRSG